MDHTGCAAFHEIDCDLEQLVSLLEVIVDQIEGIDAHIEPRKAAKIAGDLARIARDCLAGTAGKLAAIAI